MMTAEENVRITRVGPGTPTGDLLRRYWMPIATSDEIKGRPVKKRLLCEDLIVFRDGSGKVGVVDRQCAHRRADLAVAICEDNGIRCGYHGWLYSHDGQCIEQPAETRHNPNARIKAYPAQELGGLVFTYMGPQPAPLLPRFDLFVWDNVLRDIGHAIVPCNWLQAMENSVDPHHVEWLHGRLLNFWLKTGGSNLKTDLFTRKHIKTGFDAFEFGIIKRRVVEGRTEEDDDWKIGHPVLYPITLLVGGAGVHQLQIRVPIDDTSMWHLWYNVYRAPGSIAPHQATIPSYEVPMFDAKGEPIVDFIDGQDVAMWVGQGAIADRSKELLGVRCGRGDVAQNASRPD
jgi:5,5'-dehydrodivanillate O-demethylase oxygenase subunit